MGIRISDPKAGTISVRRQGAGAGPWRRPRLVAPPFSRSAEAVTSLARAATGRPSRVAPVLRAVTVAATTGSADAQSSGTGETLRPRSLPDGTDRAPLHAPLRATVGVP